MSKYYEIPKIDVEHVSFREGTCYDGMQHIYQFENNYGASVTYHEHSYGIELAVVKFYDGGFWYQVYDTPITDDVICFIKDKDELEEILERIKALWN